MKMTLLAMVLIGTSGSTFATVTAEQLNGLAIKSAPAKQVGQSVEINGEQFYKQNQAPSLSRSSRSLAKRTTPIIKGDIVTAANGFNEYEVTGEIVVELSTNNDAKELAEQHNLLLKQAYKQYYVLVDEQGRDLNQLISALERSGQVKSANIDLRDTSLGIQ